MREFAVSQLFTGRISCSGHYHNVTRLEPGWYRCHHRNIEFVEPLLLGVVV